jgi:hypothetical protein
MKLILKLEYETDCKTKEEALDSLAEDFERENTNANNEFWNNIEVKK